MGLRVSSVFLSVLLLAGTTFQTDYVAWTGAPTVSDSAQAELAAGRFWHAARLLRAEGAENGSPDDIVILAKAEAGWENWAAVVEVLSGVSWLGEKRGGEGFVLLGRAHEHAEDWASAASAYQAYLRLPSADDTTATAVRVRLARSMWLAGDHQGSLARLRELRSVPHARSWLAAELALVTADYGDVDGVRLLLRHIVEPAAVAEVWRVEADALIELGDYPAAERIFASLVERYEHDRHAGSLVELGRLKIRSGDTAAGRALLIEGFDKGNASVRTRAAKSLMDLGGHGFQKTLEMARILDRAGDGSRALTGYDRAASLAAVELVVFPESSRVERARLMSTVQSRQEEALAEFRAIRETTNDARIGARNLEVWAQMRRRQGMSPQVSTLRRWLLEEYPSSGEAAEVAWSEGSNAEARGDLTLALDRYAFLAANVRTHSRAGQARMRSGQIYLRESDLESAADVFEAYLRDFPDGRRWQEAAYWAGSTRLQMGDTTLAETQLNHVLTQPVDYYAAMASDLLDIPFILNVPHGSAPTKPRWLEEGLERLDLLSKTGLQAGANSEITRLRDRAGSERGPRLGLAEALIERGYTIDGINLGWGLFRDEGAWDQEILRVTYPFPYRELISRAAEDWGISPYLVAAIIRQESAFKADIVSHAGAIGLMQVMPPTGTELARTHGPEGFTPESLTRPEVNLHLGSAFFVAMSRRYDYELPFVLSAYNAGPTRATRWRRYPEASDLVRFTERIPFSETRGYVKNVRRNLAIYRALYGQN